MSDWQAVALVYFWKESASPALDLVHFVTEVSFPLVVMLSSKESKVDLLVS